jgi:DNA polymerase III subunit chi
MTEVRFYHLTRKTLEQALPELLEKVREKGWRAVIKTGSAEREDFLNRHLWLYRPDSFLAHGTDKDGFPDQQPLYLTTTDDRPNGASVLVLTDTTTTPIGASYDLICDLFDGQDNEATAAARDRWKSYKAEGFDVTYWQQTDKGWQKQG